MPRNTKPTLDMDTPISEENRDMMRQIRQEKEDEKHRGEENKASTTKTNKAKGGAVKSKSKSKSSASKRADGCAQRGKTKGRIY